MRRWAFIVGIYIVWIAPNRSYNHIDNNYNRKFVRKIGEKMPLMRFTKLTDHVRSHQKRQTMRKRRKKPLKKDDLLHVWVIEKLGTAPIISLKTKKLRDITLEDAHKDGFMTIHDCQETLMKMHKCGLDEEFDIIQFHPYWKANIIVEVD